MKKLLSIILTAVILLSVCAFVAGAYSDEYISFEVDSNFSNYQKSENAELWMADNYSTFGYILIDNTVNALCSEFTDNDIREFTEAFKQSFISNANTSSDLKVEVDRLSGKKIMHNGYDCILVEINGRYVFSGVNDVGFTGKEYVFTSEDKLIIVSGTLLSDTDIDAFERSVNTIKLNFLTENPEDSEKNEGKKIPTVWIVLIAVIFVAAVIMIVLILSLNKKNNTPSGPAVPPYGNGTYPKGNNYQNANNNTQGGNNYYG